MAEEHRLTFAFVLMPFANEFDEVYRLAIKPACQAVGVRCERVDEQLFMESIMERIYNQIAEADFIIADLTDRNPNVFYEVGYAHSLRKPVLLLTRSAEDIPFDLKHHPHVVYESRLRGLEEELRKRVAWIVHHLPELESLISPAVPKLPPSHSGAAPVPRDEVFLSYSHKDTKWLKRLQIHLRPLERDGSMKRFDDTMIDPGQDWKLKIREAVATAKVAVLLVSADFIASEFIHTNELPPLLVAAKSQGAVILPVIVSPCRFEQIKNLSQFQALNPPSKPLINMSKNQQEQLFVNVTNAIESALQG